MAPSGLRLRPTLKHHLRPARTQMDLALVRMLPWVQTLLGMGPHLTTSLRLPLPLPSRWLRLRPKRSQLSQEARRARSHRARAKYRKASACRARASSRKGSRRAKETVLLGHRDLQHARRGGEGIGRLGRLFLALRGGQHGSASSLIEPLGSVIFLSGLGRARPAHASLQATRCWSSLILS